MADNDVTRIAGNIGAMNSLYALTNINKQLSIHQTRLSTGKRINSAADDPAGLAISTKMMARSEGLKVALSNIGDAKNLLAVAESGLGRLNDIMIQMRSKAEQAASDTMGTEERNIVKEQLLSYANQINDIVTQTKWGSTNLIDGSTPNLTFQTGAGYGDTTVLDTLTAMDATSLHLLTAAAGFSTASVGPGGFTVGSFLGDIHAVADIFEGTGWTGMSELETGDYKVRITGIESGGLGTGVDQVSAQLWKDGIIQQVDTDAVEGGDVGTTLTMAYTGGGELVRFGNGLCIHPTAGLTAGTHVALDLTYTKGGTVGVNVAGDTADDYATYMGLVDTAIIAVNSNLSKIGSLTGSLTFKEDQISAAQINVEASYNRIMNANMAEEQVNASKLSILQQTSTAMLAQANAAPQFLLSLFR
jgi:flagellin